MNVILPMNEQELKEYAATKQWKWVVQNGLPLGGYWKDSEGNCYYAKRRAEEQLKLNLKRGEKK